MTLSHAHLTFRWPKHPATVSERSAVEITVLHAPGCAGLSSARARLTDAIALSGVKGAVTVVEAATIEDARRLGLAGSPAIVIEGALTIASRQGRAPSLGDLLSALRPYGDSWPT